MLVKFIAMKKLCILLFPALVFITASSFAQNELDALRYGQQTSLGTALSLGLGGAGGAMGGDFSMLGVNPAGIGVYRSSEITFTPSLRFNNVNTTYLGNTQSDNKTRLNISNLGFVFTKSATGKRYESAAWKSISFGIGYNRLADFNQNITYSGLNNQSSISELFAASAQNYGVSSDVAPPWGYLGYEGYLLDDNFNSIVPYTDGLTQRKSQSTKGGLGEFSFTFGGNYKEKLMLGLSVGMQYTKYSSGSVFSEDDASGNTNNNFSYLDYYENLSTHGLGVNVKIGAIYVVNEYLKLGAAFHTPTWSAFTDSSYYSLQSNTEAFHSDITAEPQTIYSFDYTLRTPWSATANASVMLGKYGMINADYEAVGYNSMHYTMHDFPDYAASINKAIKETYQLGHIVRVGVEGRMDNFMGRLGFAYHTNPYKDVTQFTGGRMDVSVGAGLRFGGFFIDAGYMHSFLKNTEYGYPGLVSGVPVALADMKYGNNTVALTIGFKM